MALDKVRSSAAAVMGLVVAAAALLSPPAPGSFNDEGTCLVAAFIPAPSVVVAAGRRPPRSCALLTRFMVLPAVSDFFCTARRRRGVQYAVNTLVEIKKALNDPNGVLRAWDPEVIAAGDELCDWPMVVCNVKDQVFRLYVYSPRFCGLCTPL